MMIFSALAFPHLSSLTGYSGLEHYLISKGNLFGSIQILCRGKQPVSWTEEV